MLACWDMDGIRSVSWIGRLLLDWGRLQIKNYDCKWIAIDSTSALTETSHRQRVVQSVHEHALVRHGLSLCLKSGTLAIWRCPSISFRAALRQRVRSVKSDAHVARPRINSSSVSSPHLNQ